MSHFGGDLLSAFEAVRVGATSSILPSEKRFRCPPASAIIDTRRISLSLTTGSRKSGHRLTLAFRGRLRPKSRVWLTQKD